MRKRGTENGVAPLLPLPPASEVVAEGRGVNMSLRRFFAGVIDSRGVALDDSRGVAPEERAPTHVGTRELQRLCACTIGGGAPGGIMRGEGAAKLPAGLDCPARRRFSFSAASFFICSRSYMISAANCRSVRMSFTSARQIRSDE